MPPLALALPTASAASLMLPFRSSVTSPVSHALRRSIPHVRNPSLARALHCFRWHVALESLRQRGLVTVDAISGAIFKHAYRMQVRLQGLATGRHCVSPSWAWSSTPQEPRDRPECDRNRCTVLFRSRWTRDGGCRSALTAISLACWRLRRHQTHNRLSAVRSWRRRTSPVAASVPAGPRRRQGRTAWPERHRPWCRATACWSQYSSRSPGWWPCRRPA